MISVVSTDTSGLSTIRRVTSKWFLPVPKLGAIKRNHLYLDTGLCDHIMEFGLFLKVLRSPCSGNHRGKAYGDNHKVIPPCRAWPNVYLATGRFRLTK